MPAWPESNSKTLQGSGDGSGLTGGYLIKAEALLELAIECAEERRRNE
jgi:hypothetical protein